MIPKASQRGGGKDLATHLLNAFDNEYVEVAEVSGAVAPDLHGAFAEWEAIATGLTKCRNYLYSLSVNPDLGQGQLSRAQYVDYIDRGMALPGTLAPGRLAARGRWRRQRPDHGYARAWKARGSGRHDGANDEA